MDVTLSLNRFTFTDFVLLVVISVTTKAQIVVNPHCMPLYAKSVGGSRNYKQEACTGDSIIAEIR